MSKLPFRFAFKSDRLPGFSLGRRFFGAIGLKDRLDRVIRACPALDGSARDRETDLRHSFRAVRSGYAFPG
jgi:hypothetical protein